MFVDSLQDSEVSFRPNTDKYFQGNFVAPFAHSPWTAS